MLCRHAHSDHYTNLSKSWKHGPIYCSHTTANLVIHMLGVDPQWVVSLRIQLKAHDSMECRITCPLLCRTQVV